jgi:cyanate permease
MGVAVANSLASFLTTYSVEVGFSEGAAGFVLALGSATGIAMRVIIGWLADRHTLGLGAVSLLLVIGSVGIAMLTTGSQILIVFGSMLAFGAGWGWAGLFNLAVVQRNPQAPAVATGFTQIGVYVGAGLGPFLFGVLAEHASFQTAWWVFATMAIFAAALMRVGDRATLRAAGVQIPD